MDLTLFIGIAAGIFSSISMLPQLIKIIKEKKADDISPLMLLILIVGVSLWVVYGFLKSDIPIIATNSFSVLLNILVATLKIRYSRQ